MKNVNSDIAYTYIRKKILSGSYPPGDALMTKELSKEIGVSRTPVRDALRQLEADGLVTIRARLGASVKTMTSNEYREMCGLRLALEAYAAGLSAENRTIADLRELKHTLETMRTLTTRLTDGDDAGQSIFEELRRADVRFHIGIISAAKNELIKKEVLRLHLVSRVVAGPSVAAGASAVVKPSKHEHLQGVQTSHDAIYTAIEHGDAFAAKLAMERHIQDIIDANIKVMTHADLSSARELSEEELSYST